MKNFWQEDSDKKEPWQVPENIVDVAFRLNGKTIATDHAWELFEQVNRLLPWFAEDEQSALHQIHVAESGNGWQRPDEFLQLSRRTRLTLRLPSHRLESVRLIEGQVLQMASGDIVLGTMSIKRLVKSPVIFSRYVDVGENENEERFLEIVFSILQERKVACRKMLCGRMQTIKHPAGALRTRSLMLADLDIKDAIAIQERGIGDHQNLGCGVFLAHKGIDAVSERQSQIID